jgi:hypothetical protein
MPSNFADVIAQTVLPTLWTFSSHTHPDDQVIHEAQGLNYANRVATPPAHYLRGEVVPSLRPVSGTELEKWRHVPPQI